MRSGKIIFISGGGTGGHVFPSVAIAEALLELNPEIKIKFIGTRLGMETRIIPQLGFDLILLPGGKLNFSGNVTEKIKTILKLPIAFIKSIFLLIKYRPIYVLGVGGYASASMVLAAAFLRFPTGIWEPNAIPGLANRILAKFVDQIFVVFYSANQAFGKSYKTKQFGMPLRKSLEVSLNESVSSMSNENKKKFTLFVFGGSQGARAINHVIFQMVDKYFDQFEKEQIFIIHQTGRLDFDQAKKRYQNKQDFIEFYEFIDDMAKFYKKSDLAICRSGASTVAEIKPFGLVPIFIPLPLADDHQGGNAKEIIDQGAGFMILQKNLTVDGLWNLILQIKKDPQKLQEASKRLKQLHIPQASLKIAKCLLNSDYKENNLGVL